MLEQIYYQMLFVICIKNAKEMFFTFQKNLKDFKHAHHHDLNSMVDDACNQIL